MLSGLCPAKAERCSEGVEEQLRSEGCFVQDLAGPGAERLIDHALDKAVGVNDHGGLGERRILAQNSQDVPSVGTGEEQVKQDGVGPCGGNLGEACRAVGGKFDSVTGVGKPCSEKFSRDAIVFDDQDFHAKRRWEF